MTRASHDEAGRGQPPTAVGRDASGVGPGGQSGRTRAAQGRGAWEAGCCGPAPKSAHALTLHSDHSGGIADPPHPAPSPWTAGGFKRRRALIWGHTESPRLVRAGATRHVLRLVTMEEQCEGKGRTSLSKLKSLNLTPLVSSAAQGRGVGPGSRKRGGPEAAATPSSSGLRRQWAGGPWGDVAGARGPQCLFLGAVGKVIFFQVMT